MNKIEKATSSEPDIEDAPVSSSDSDGVTDVSDGDYKGNKGGGKGRGKSLAEKLSDNSNKKDGVNGTQRGRRRKDPPSRQNASGKKPKRTLTSISGDGSDDDLLFFSSQNTKRQKSTYGASQGPRSSGASSGSAKPKPVKKVIKEEEEEEEKHDEDDDGGFKVPRHIDLASPPPKQEPLSNSTADSLFDLDGDSPLSSPPGSIDLADFGLTEQDKAVAMQARDSTESDSLCPMCKAKVDPDTLRLFMLRPKRERRVRDQQRFCHSHKQQSAEQEWNDRGYPEIDWATFDERIIRHFKDLEKILVPDSQSYYRNVLAESVKSGKARFLRLSLSGDGLETISCGYYGSRGASKM